MAATAIFLPKTLPLILSLPVLLFLLGYSLAKRFTSLCHYWLSAALMLSPVAAWIAVRNEFSLIPASLAAVIFFWVGGFDILYACQDADFDRSARLHSIPAQGWHCEGTAYRPRQSSNHHCHAARSLANRRTWLDLPCRCPRDRSAVALRTFSGKCQRPDLESTSPSSR
ncbi:MAG UNVERIFIED_CONTAM: UbiA family prenyltransferase [Planctomycetaceae bacterium]